jgi:hypothetical protein
MNHFLQTHRRHVIAGSAAGIAAVGLLCTGVASAASSGLSTNAAPTTNSGPTTARPATAAGPATGAAPSGPASSSAAAGQRADAMKEIRAQLKAGVTHGTVTVTTKKGAKTVVFERGTVQAATATGFEVTDASGTQSWVVGPKMKVRERGQHKAGASPTSSASVVNGESVIVVGVPTGSTSTARLVVVLPATKHGTSKHGASTPATATPGTTT